MLRKKIIDNTKHNEIEINDLIIHKMNSGRKKYNKIWAFPRTSNFDLSYNAGYKVIWFDQLK